MIGKIGLTLGIAFNVAILALSHGHMSYGYEVRGNLWEPGKQILQGKSPYDPATPKRALAEGTSDCCIQALYPAPTHVFFAPLSWLPFDAAVVLFNTTIGGNGSFADRLGEHIAERLSGKPAISLKE